MEAFWVVVLLATAETILDGLVLMVIWGWFVSETFGLAPLSFPIAAGLVLTVGLLTNRYRQETKFADWRRIISLEIDMSLFILALGFVFYLFV